jgi:hypothetical protein
MSQKFSEYLSRKRQQDPTISLNSNQKKSSAPQNNEPKSPAVLKKEESQEPDWTNYELFVQKWQSDSKLPPLLSPKIPVVFESTNNCDDAIIPKLLSPTLPPQFDDGDSKVPKLPPLTKEAESKETVVKKRRGSHVMEITKRGTLVKSLTLTLKVPALKESLKPHQKKKKTTVNVETAQNQNQKPGENDEVYEGLIKQKNKYLERARSEKHKGDSYRSQNKIKHSLVHFIDSINLYLFGFHYEDASRRLIKKLYNDQPWLSLIQLIDSVLKLSVENEINVVAGLCLQVRSVLYEHVSMIVGEFVQLDHARRRRLLEQKKDMKVSDERYVGNVKSYMKYKELAKKGLIEADRYLSVFELVRRYPALMQEFKTTIQERETADDTADRELIGSDTFRLPVSQGLSLREIIGYSVRVSKAWADENGVSHEWRY